MMTYRRMSFQLTPLLDLMLIVFFSQYLEVQIQTERLQVGLLAEQRAAAEQMGRLQAKLIELQGTSQEVATLRDNLRVAEVQRDRVGELVAEIFRLPTATVQSLIQAWQPGTGGANTVDFQAIPQRLRALAESRGPEIIQHLLTFDELRKRSDLWTLHLRDDDVVVVQAGTLRTEFRATTSQEFVNRLTQFFKQLPETKSLVLILVSYGDTRFDVRQAMFQSLPTVMTRLRQESGDRSRFDYAVLGFRSKSPL